MHVLDLGYPQPELEVITTTLVLNLPRSHLRYLPRFRQLKLLSSRTSVIIYLQGLLLVHLRRNFWFGNENDIINVLRLEGHYWFF